MNSPCIAACKNEAGICAGCLRTINEIALWRNLNANEQITTIEQIKGTTSTHSCPNCDSASFCDIAAGKKHCWCFDIEKRDLSNMQKFDKCLCRKCLSSLDIA